MIDEETGELVSDVRAVHIEGAPVGWWWAGGGSGMPSLGMRKKGQASATRVHTAQHPGVAGEEAVVA